MQREHGAPISVMNWSLYPLGRVVKPDHRVGGLATTPSTSSTSSTAKQHCVLLMNLSRKAVNCRSRQKEKEYLGLSELRHAPVGILGAKCTCQGCVQILLPVPSSSSKPACLTTDSARPTRLTWNGKQLEYLRADRGSAIMSATVSRHRA